MRALPGQPRRVRAIERSCQGAGLPSVGEGQRAEILGQPEQQSQLVDAIRRRVEVLHLVLGERGARKRFHQSQRV